MDTKDNIIIFSIIIILIFILYVAHIMGYEVKTCGITSGGQLVFC